MGNLGGRVVGRRRQTGTVVSTKRKAERTRLMLRPKRAPSRAKQRHRAAFQRVTYSDNSATKPTNWTGVLDLGDATRIDRSALIGLRVRFHMARSVTVTGGSECLRALVADQLLEDGIPRVRIKRIGQGSRCQHGQCASCLSWPFDATTLAALIAALPPDEEPDDGGASP